MTKTTTQQVASHSLFNMVGNATRVGLSVLLNMTAARILGPQGFGDAGTIFAYLVFMQYLLTLGFDNSLTYFVARFESEGALHKSKEVLKIALTASLIGGVIFSIIATWLAPSWLARGQMSGLLIATLIYIYQTELWSLASVISGFLRGTKEFFPVIMKDQFLFPVVNMLGFILCAQFTSGVMAYVLGYSIASFACLIFMIYWMFRVIRRPAWQKAAAQPLREISQVQAREWLWFSFPLGVMSGLEPLLASIGLIVGRLFLPAEQIGGYNVCMRATLFSQFLLLALGPIFSPYLAELYKKNERTEFRNLLQIVTYWSAKWSLLLTFFMSVSADYLLTLFGGHAYSSASIALLLILPGTAIEACFGTIKHSLVMSGHNRIHVFNFLLAIAVNIAAGFLLIPRYGLNGLAFSFTLAYGILNLLRVVEFYYFQGIKPLNSRYTRNILILGISLLVIGWPLAQSDLAGRWRFLLSLFITVAGLIVVYWKDRDVFLGQLARRRRAS